ncbi:hypothetical protein, unknown function [Leishmania infantum JPCM5]|uniref:Uncharacterized protein n=2 Tax=Leishmania infantum TaxID=5671 RepID=A4HY38_LEIIN|nr:hypothetical protein, unknown function [Leishmania infantum JPCM5]CAC9481897.1 hypothetical_protein_-_conserved [Leishmania infantum]CAM67221.1 hypothetical protein, unknown function [Leishmania infantum JPCM5]SUZ41097.1 hypothetical_protein_-_conserved [Leishmania infantum]|eukprot:XP_001464979.1 hypothetical protein, unknown function [Leishmania infantum JPCM5]
MSELGRDHLPHIQGVAAFRKSDISTMPSVAAACRASEPLPRLYTSTATLGRIYAPSAPHRMTKGTASTHGRAAPGRRFHAVTAGSRALTTKDMHCRHPYHLMPLGSSYHTPLGYYRDALRFAQTVEESQRTAIKFEERRCRLRLYKKCASHAHRIAPPSRETRHLACTAEPPQPVKTVGPPAFLIVSYDSMSSVSESKLEDEDHNSFSPPSPRVLQEKEADNVVENLMRANNVSAHARWSTAGTSATPPLFLGDQLSRRPCETKEHLPTLPAQLTGPPGIAASKGDARDAGAQHELLEQQPPRLVETPLTSHAIWLSTSHHYTEPAPSVAPVLEFSVYPLVHRAAAHEDSRTTLKTLTMSGAPHGDPGTLICLDTLRTERLLEALQWVEAAIQHATELQAHRFTAPPQLYSLEAEQSSAVRQGTKPLQPPQHNPQEEQPPWECTPMTEVVPRRENVPFEGLKELRALRRKEAAALVSSCFSVVIGAVPQSMCGKGTPTTPLAAVTAPTEYEAAANPLSSVPPRPTSAASEEILHQLRLEVSRTMVSSILSCTAAVHRALVPRNQMCSANREEKVATALDLFSPPLLRQTSLVEHHDGTLSPPMLAPAREADLYQLRRDLAHQLATTVTQSTHPTEFAYADIDRAKAANISEPHFHKVSIFPRIV